jgi:hypothetical protein
MKKLTITILLLTSFSAFADNVSNEDLKQQIKTLTERVVKLEINKEKQKIIINDLSSDLDSLKNQTEANSSAIISTKNNLDIKIKETGKASEDKISAIGQSLSKNSLIGIIGVLMVLLISGILFWFLSKRQKIDKNDVEQLIQNTKRTLSEEGVRLDTKLVQILESQIKLIQEERIISSTKVEDTEIDHSLPLKVADEITRINAYANTLNPNSQDSKALKSSVKRLTNTFKAASYEIFDLLGQKYDDRIPMVVLDRIIDGTLINGEETITRIIKPLVKYKGIQIQAAQVETTYNDKIS